MSQGFLEVIGHAYLAAAAVAVLVALWLPKTARGKALAAVVVAGVASIPALTSMRQQQEKKVAVSAEQVQVSKAAARFKELCKGAGSKIFRTVDDVEGVMLLKVRPKLKFKDHLDPMLPGAAMAGERSGDEYIGTFLGREGDDIGRGRPGGRGGIAIVEKPTGPRYRYVDVVDMRDGVRYRYTATVKLVQFMGSDAKPNSSMQAVVERRPTTEPAPRYAVDYEDVINPEDRKLWIAGTIIRVIDQLTGDVLGEHSIYAWDAGMGTSNGTRAPWEYASGHGSMHCPKVDGAVDSRTRYFVDQVLVPKKGE